MIVFEIQKPKTDRFTPASETRYSAFDPQLSVSGKSIPFLGDEPLKFLGREMSSKKNGLNRAEIKENFPPQYPTRCNREGT